MSMQKANDFNRELITQAHSTRRRIVSRITRMSVKGKAELLKEVQSAQARQALLKRMGSEKVLARSFFVKFGRRHGEIDLVSFRFPIHGIYTHHGVSRGHPATNKRKQTEWLNPIMDTDIEKFADIVARHYGDASLNATRIKI